MRLSFRLTLAFTVLGTVAVAAVATVSWLASAREVRQAADEALEDTRTALLTFVESDVGRRFREDPDPDNRFLEGLERQSGGIVVLSDGSWDSNGRFAVPSVAVEQILRGEEVSATITVEDRVYRTLTVPIDPLPVGQGGGVTLIGALLYEDVTSEEQAIDSLAVQLALVGLAAVAAVAAAGWVLGRRLARPLVDLTDAVDYLAEHGVPPQRIELDRSDEIGRLAARFNAMLAAVEVGREQQQRLVADASHELRTPLTALRLRAEHAASFDTLTPEQRGVVEGAVGDLEQLSALVADLIDLAALVSPADEEPVYCDLATIIGPVIDRSAVAAQRSITFDADESAGLVYPTMIRRAVQNLVDNAVKYSPDDQPIHVRIDGGTIEVRDHGAGIAPEDLAFIFDRFFRSPKARTRPGNGIGLAIVKEVAERHNGTASATNEADGGARVGFSVPGLSVVE